MTIDDAIRFCEIESERMKNQWGSEFIQDLQLAESSKRFEQMGEMLKELKEYRISVRIGKLRGCRNCKNKYYDTDDFPCNACKDYKYWELMEDDE